MEFAWEGSQSLLTERQDGLPLFSHLLFVFSCACDQNGVWVRAVSNFSFQSNKLVKGLLFFVLPPSPLSHTFYLHAAIHPLFFGVCFNVGALFFTSFFHIHPMNLLHLFFYLIPPCMLPFHHLSNLFICTTFASSLAHAYCVTFKKIENGHRIIQSRHPGL